MTDRVKYAAALARLLTDHPAPANQNTRCTQLQATNQANLIVEPTCVLNAA